MKKDTTKICYNDRAQKINTEHNSTSQNAQNASQHSTYANQNAPSLNSKHAEDADPSTDEGIPTSTRLTTDAGVPVVDNENSLTAGPRGPLLAQDIWLNEKLGNFSREVIPERRMHAKGSGAHGQFTVTNDITQYTKAKLFSEVGKTTELFLRFSTVAGERGAADAERDIRGFAIKFYTEEGNWDLVGINMPVFLVRDARKFPDLNKAIKRDPQTNLPSPTYKWDFWTLLPESFHHVTMQMSDRGIPTSYRHMHGYGNHAFSFLNKKDERFWVKFHFKTQQGIKNLTDEQAETIIGQDRDSHQRDLFNAIEQGDYPKWTMCIQVMPEVDAEKLTYNPFDATKVWLHKDYPLIEVGTLELNRNPLNYFQDVEQASFSPANVPPGISFSPDKLLQGRIFNYADAQRYRVGVNHAQIPVNAPRATCAFSNRRDGQGRMDGNYWNLVHYEPNSYHQWESQPDYREPPLKISGDGDFWDYREDDSDYFSQARLLFLLMNSKQQYRLFFNTARSLGNAPDFIKYRHIRNCHACHEYYGKGVAWALDLTVEDAIAARDRDPALGQPGLL